MPARIEGYAAAVFEAARAEDAVDVVGDELYRFSYALENNAQLRKALFDESIPVERRQGIIEELLEGKVSRLTSAIVSFLVATGRARELSEIANHLVKRIAAEHEREVAEVRSAIPLTEDQRTRLAEALTNSLGKPVEVRVIVDPSVMGGILARVGDVVIDGTIRHRLELLKEAM
ncbi:MAG: F-type H+-transporting ATPase subunit delta [Actinomycetota bacterium]|nr:F-type H+-transporting ATPase subunit delta [Actinomycetota bacterium]